MILTSLRNAAFVAFLGLLGSEAIADSYQTHDRNQNGWSTRGCTHGDSGLACARFVKNYDGDTITFDIPNVHPLLGDEIMVRVKGIDTPELRTKDNCEKKAAIKAQKMVENLLTSAERVDLTNAERGKYFRVLADITVDGRSLARRLIQAGLAVPYDGGTRPDVNWCGR